MLTPGLRNVAGLLLLSRNVVSFMCDLKFSSSLAFKKLHLEITIESQEVAKYVQGSPMHPSLILP